MSSKDQNDSIRWWHNDNIRNDGILKAVRFNDEEKSIQLANLMSYHEGIVLENINMDNNFETVLSRSYQPMLITALLIYISFEWVFLYSVDYCNNSVTIDFWMQIVQIAICGSFLLVAFFHATLVLMMFAMSPDSAAFSCAKSVYLTISLISIISGVSVYMQLMGGSEMICKDQFGVESFMSQWPAMLATTPLMLHVVIGLEDKPNFYIMDIVFIIVTFLSILSLFLTSNVTNTNIELYLIGTSLILMSIGLYIPIECYKKIQHYNDNLESTIKYQSLEDQFHCRWLNDKICLKLRLWYILFTSFIIYILLFIFCGNQVISNTEYLIGNTILNFMTKIIFFAYLSFDIDLSKIFDINKKSANSGSVSSTPPSMGDQEYDIEQLSMAMRMKPVENSKTRSSMKGNNKMNPSSIKENNLINYEMKKNEKSKLLVMDNIPYGVVYNM